MIRIRLLVGIVEENLIDISNSYAGDIKQEKREGARRVKMRPYTLRMNVTVFCHPTRVTDTLSCVHADGCDYLRQ